MQNRVPSQRRIMASFDIQLETPTQITKDNDSVPKMTADNISYLETLVEFEFSHLPAEELEGIKNAIKSRFKPYQYWVGWIDGYKSGESKTNRESILDVLKDLKEAHLDCQQKVADVQLLVDGTKKMFEECRVDVEKISDHMLAESVIAEAKGMEVVEAVFLVVSAGIPPLTVREMDHISATAVALLIKKGYDFQKAMDIVNEWENHRRPIDEVL